MTQEMNPSTLGFKSGFSAIFGPLPGFHVNFLRFNRHFVSVPQHCLQKPFA
jgi:hypothetical protein